MQFEKQNIRVVPDGSSTESLVGMFIEESNWRQSDDPFFITNLSGVVSQWEKWQSLMPGVLPHFAMKADPDNVIMYVLAELGASFDCASKQEMAQVFSLGLNSSRIVFSNPIKSAGTLRYARAWGVDLMVFDNSEALKTIKELYPKAKLLLRIKAADETAIMAMDTKFGCDPTIEAKKLLQEAAELQLNVIGVSFHVGYLSRTPKAYGIAIENARNLFDEASKLGFSFTMLDIGGGFPGVCNSDAALENTAIVVKNSLDEYFGDVPHLRVISEPGTFFVQASTALCINVIGKKKQLARNINPNAENSEENGFYYYVNDGIYGSFAGLVAYNQHEPIIPYKNYKAKEKWWSRIFGQSCDPIDIIEQKIRLPELNVGDWLVCQNMGAYTRAIHSDFNGFTMPQTYYVFEEKDMHLLQRITDNHYNKLPYVSG